MIFYCLLGGNPRGLSFYYYLSSSGVLTIFLLFFPLHHGILRKAQTVGPPQLVSSSLNMM